MPIWTALRPEGASSPEGSVLGSVLGLEPLTLQVGARSLWHFMEPPLLLGWALATASLLALALSLLFRTRRLKRDWVPGELQGRTILLAEEWGPAVVGFFHPRIVLPRWCSTLEEDELKLILDHEAEHLRAGDLPLLLLAGLPPVLLPWSLPLWWMWRRLRLAVEGDCDLRVLRKNPRATRAYLELLLEVGRRVPGHRLAAAMLSEPERTLERRIKIMTMPFPRKPFLRGALLVTGGAVLVAVACLAPTPTAVDEEEPTFTAVEVPADLPSSQISQEPTFTPYTVRPDIMNREEVARAMQSNYPPLLRDAGIGGTATVWFFLDETGRVQNVRINGSSGHQALDEAALRVAEAIQFTPALNKEKPVPVWISLPITFTTR